MGLSLDVTPLIERLCDAVSKRRERDRQICKDVLKVIRKEKSNFERIVTDTPYGNDPLERMARTQYSFEEVAKAMRNLSRVRKFRAAAKKIQILCELQLGRPANERKAKELLALINEIEPKIVHHSFCKSTLGVALLSVLSFG